MKTYEPKEMARKIMTELGKTGDATPTTIARNLGYSPKTVSKYVDLLEDLGHIQCRTIHMGTKKIRSCHLFEREESNE